MKRDYNSHRDLARWDEVAETYAQTSGTENDHIWLQFRDVMWEALGQISGTQILDVGCGHGWLAQKMKDRGASVVGIDGSAELLRIARTRYPGITFIQHDLSNGLPETDGPFDRIVANMVLMDIPHLTILLRDIRSVLKLDGRFIFTLTHPMFFFQKTMQDSDTGDYYTQVKGYLEPTVWDVGHTHYHRSLMDYVEMLRANRLAVSRLFEPTHIPQAQNDPKREHFLKSIPKFMLIETITVTA